MIRDSSVSKGKSRKYLQQGGQHCGAAAVGRLPLLTPLKLVMEVLIKELVQLLEGIILQDSHYELGGDACGGCLAIRGNCHAQTISISSACRGLLIKRAHLFAGS